MLGNLRKEITYPFPNLNGYTGLKYNHVNKKAPCENFILLCYEDRQKEI